MASAKSKDDEDTLKCVELYEDDTSYYDTTPTGTIIMPEFTQFASDRFKLLQVIENAGKIPKHRHTDDHFHEIRNAVRERSSEFETYSLMFDQNLKPFDSMKLREARKVDHVSHFLLCLYYAWEASEDWRWFVEMEAEIYRFKIWQSKQLESLLRKTGIKFEKVTLSQDDAVYANVIASSFSSYYGPVPAKLAIYKISFIHACELVRKRSVYLNRGTAHVVESQLVEVFVQRFKQQLALKIKQIKSFVHELLESDDRLKPLLCEIRGKLVSHSSKYKPDTVLLLSTPGIGDIEDLAANFFPPCMMSLYDSAKQLRQNRCHLKHNGRLQLGLFLKGIGLSMEDAIRFWRKVLSVDDATFQSTYLYNIRYMYGMEGKRADYTPYSCAKIINNSVGPGDCHGCPFKHCDEQRLSLILKSMTSLSDEDRALIIGIAASKEYQYACRQLFQFRHPVNHFDLGKIEHPNQYYVESWKAHELMNQESADNTSLIQPTKRLKQDLDEDLVLHKLKEISFI